MAVVIEEMEGTVDPEPTLPPQQDGGGAAVSKELRLDQVRAELNRVAQREMRLKAD